jgi:hypothetical protein
MNEGGRWGRQVSRTALLLLGALLLLTALARSTPAARAVAADFRIQTLNCVASSTTGTTTTGLGHITLLNTTALTTALNGLTVAIGPVGGTAQRFVVNYQINPPAAYIVANPVSYFVAGGATLDLQVGPGAAQTPNPSGVIPVVAVPLPNPLPPPLPTDMTVALTASPLLQPGVQVQLIDGDTNQVLDTEQCPPPGLSRTFTVSPGGFDFLTATVPNAICGADLPAGTPPTLALPGPCLTIANAMVYARDGDTIVVEPGIYEVCAPIEVNKLVTIASGLDSVANTNALGAS